MIKLDIEKQLLGEYWTNRYFLDFTDPAAALIAGANIAGYEQAIHMENVLFTKYVVSDVDPSTDNYYSVPLNVYGDRSYGGTVNFLPLFNVARVDFAAGAGRPSRKYLRLPLTEGDTETGALSSALIALINTEYVAPLVALATFVDVDGTAIEGGTVFPQIGMRQLRRGTRRRTTPILP